MDLFSVVLGSSKAEGSTEVRKTLNNNNNN